MTEEAFSFVTKKSTQQLEEPVERQLNNVRRRLAWF
jgi:hypothetical protein